MTPKTKDRYEQYKFKETITLGANDVVVGFRCRSCDCRDYAKAKTEESAEKILYGRGCSAQALCLDCLIRSDVLDFKKLEARRIQPLYPNWDIYFDDIMSCYGVIGESIHFQMDGFPLSLFRSFVELVKDLMRGYRTEGLSRGNFSVEKVEGKSASWTIN